MLIDDIKRNNELSLLYDDNFFNIFILSNVIINQIKDPIELALKEKGVNAHVSFADYDNFVQASSAVNNVNVVIIFWETVSLIKGIQYKCNTWTNEETDAFLSKVKSEISLTVNNLKEVPLVLFNTFDTSLFNYNLTKENTFDNICKALNSHLVEVKTRNIQIVDISKLILTTGVQQSFNKRMWYSSSMLYTYEFLKNYASKASFYILSLSGKAKKAIVLDCDNTLWKGIVGEDGPEGIAYNINVKDGEYYEEIHYMLKELSQNGILLALNSKNNLEDVKSIFTDNPNIVLKWEDFLIKKVNWNNKVSNLKSIAKELNIGIDSLVHMDDSDFEINHINTELPEVTTIQVPQNLKDYATHLRNHYDLFLNLNKTNEDANRIEMYKVEIHRQEAQENFNNIEEYLQSLELEINIKLNDNSSIERIAQMTQKTNQFNLTTPRYTESEIENFINSGKHFVFSFGLKDKFGDYGITGLCILEIADMKTAYIDTFLMSCRIIGRNVEFAFLNFMSNFLLENKIEKLIAKYIKTFKNSQVENLFDSFGMEKTYLSDTTKEYFCYIGNLQLNNINYIKISYER
jgi:FkbH-like protein